MTRENTDTAILIEELNRCQEESRFYQRQYQQMKMISNCMVQAIRNVYSPDIAAQIQCFIDSIVHSHGVQEKSLTDTLCQLMFAGCDQEEVYSVKSTPRKYMNKSDCRLLQKSQYRDSSTRNSHKQPQNIIAKQIQCDLCQQILLPSDFMTHFEQCKYSLGVNVEKSENYSIDYQKMMKSLLLIRQEIQQQIYFVAQAGKNALRKKLENDLQRVKKIITQKESLLKRKKVKKV